MNVRRVDCGRISLSIAEEGAGDPVILLHGFPELNHSWRHQLPALAASGYHAVAPDLRGYGESDAPPEVSDYALPNLVGDIVGLLDALGVERAHMVGHDWGGSIAWVMAARMPERLRSLVILNSPHPVASAEARRIPDQQRKSWYMLLFQFPEVAEQWLAADDFANLRQFVFDTAPPETFPDADRRVFCEALARPGRLTAALNYYRANIPAESWLRPPPDLPPITVPTTILWGDADAYMSDLLLERSMTKVDGPLTVERLPGVSHWIQQEAPGRVSDLLLDALARHRDA